MKSFFVLLVIIIVSIVFFVLSDRGAELLKPYISTYIENQLEDNITVEVVNLHIDVNEINLTAILNNKTNIKAQAEVSLFEKDIINNINIDLPKANIKEILDLSHKPYYAKGEADIHIETPTLKNWKREANLQIKLYDTLLNEKVLQKELKINIPANSKVKGTIYIEKNNNILTSNGKLKSNLGNLSFDLAKYNYKTHKLDSDYYLKIYDLTKLKSIIKHKLYGGLELNGDIHKDKTLIVTGRTKSLDGIVDFKLIDNHIKADIFDVSLQKLMRVFKYPQIFNAKVVGNLNYNLKKEEGIVDVKLNNARLIPNKFTNLVEKIKDLNLTKESYNQTTFIANIDKSYIKFNFDAKGKTTSLLLKDAKLNRKTEKIYTKYTIKIARQNISGKIRGDINNPHITLDTSELIEHKILNGISKYIKNGSLEDLGIGEKEKQKIKDTFFELFR